MILIEKLGIGYLQDIENILINYQVMKSLINVDSNQVVSVEISIYFIGILVFPLCVLSIDWNKIKVN